VIETIVLFGLGVIAVAIALCFVRVIRGPSLFDRVLAFDCIALCLVGGVLLLSLLLSSAVFMDVVLVVALLGFLGAVSLAAYLEGTLVD
jgi:multisubunit Na+/H+ antiporter MnhF subunit